MKVIPREARRITYSTEIRNLKKRLSFTDFQKSVVIGTIFGDGHLTSNWSKTNYRLKVSHSIKQKDYLIWKYNILKEWVLTKPKYGAKTNSLTFMTISHPEITELEKIFYKEGKKIIPGNLEEFIRNPLILAVWFMDDGNIIRRNGKIYGYHLNTQSFTFEENHQLLKLLSKIHGINSLLERNHGKYRLRIMQRDSRNKFLKIIENQIINNMRYKIS